MIKLCIPSVGEEDVQAIREVIESKNLVQGKKVLEFEKRICDYLKVKNAIAVSSGTAALHLALMALEISSGDEVIIPDFTFPATANVVEVIGGITKFVDIDLDSLCIDTSKIEEQITDKTKVIIPVQEFGQSADMEKIITIAKKYNLKVIEDAACALGAEYKRNMVGTIGDIGCFSLHPRKAITTGEGGIVVTNDDELAEKIRVLRNHGIKYEDGKAQFVLPGLNYRMTDIQGAMALVQMNKLKDINKKRQELAFEYSTLLSKVEKVRIPVEMKNCKHIWQTYHIILDEKIDRDKFICKLKEEGIETNFGAHAVHCQKYYIEKYEYSGYENAVKAYKQGVALPLHDRLDKESIKFIVDKIISVIAFLLK